ncbi:hypothetical protein SOV_49170 [Sporomusa ovata DSM 2662]|uniref:Uncharacterized protein n=1 Tax=Sporomusa ovata TaxID=2378 RepID=A0A0U1L1U4_9FIRM|nr:hypothetical protein [Sporomusa ovata]EQB27291.1 hypothetical protein SOV_2c01860 [Sporomusa ovata DSM 2662]CQR73133.1 hypothetical protein SpAn4DRAFT_2365 [Sporomusa ovata]
MDHVFVSENNELSKEELKEIEELLAELPNIIEKLERDVSNAESESEHTVPAGVLQNP